MRTLHQLQDTLARSTLHRAAVLLACLAPLACNQGVAPDAAPARIVEAAPVPALPVGPGYFEEVSRRTRIDFTYRNGEEADHHTILESLGGGVAMLDYDRDGLLDIFLTGGGHFGPNREILGYPCKLYRNLGNWSFQDVTAAVGLDKIDFYSHGTAVGDFNGDGWPDLLVTGYGRMSLFQNQHGKFEDVTEAAGLRDRRLLHWSTGAAWGDFNGDGHLDLFVAHYVTWSFQNHPRCTAYQPGHDRDVCNPKSFEPLLPQLFINNGNGSFRDATSESGMKPGKALGVVVADLDNDGKLDIYVANDTVNSHLYLNKGGGQFEEVGVARGAAVNESGSADGSMGVDVADYNGSGQLSVFVTNYQAQVHGLYRNLGKGRFRHHSARAGLTAIGMDYVGFGTGFVDFDLDGDEDIFISNGHVLRYPLLPWTLAQKPVLLRNSFLPGDKPFAVHFNEVSAQGGPYFQANHRGRGVAFGDLDNDGKIDLVISHVNEPVALLRNAAKASHHWLGVELVDPTNRAVIGAQLMLELGGQKLLRTIKGGGSYLSANDSRVVFGLGGHTQVGRLTIRWPSGSTQSVENLALDRYVKVTARP